MPMEITVYRRSFPAKHRWLVEQRIEKALEDLQGLPEWTANLTTGQCLVLVTLSPSTQETAP